MQAFVCPGWWGNDQATPTYGGAGEICEGSGVATSKKKRPRRASLHRDIEDGGQAKPGAVTLLALGNLDSQAIFGEDMSFLALYRGNPR